MRLKIRPAYASTFFLILSIEAASHKHPQFDLANEHFPSLSSTKQPNWEPLFHEIRQKKKNKFQRLQQIIEDARPVSIINGNGRWPSPLTYSLIEGDPKCTRHLIKLKADVNQKDGLGKTPLQTAIDSKNSSSAISIAILLDSGAEFDQSLFDLGLNEEENKLELRSYILKRLIYVQRHLLVPACDRVIEYLFPIQIKSPVPDPEDPYATPGPIEVSTTTAWDYTCWKSEKRFGLYHSDGKVINSISPHWLLELKKEIK